MERFTNDAGKFIDQLKLELLAYEQEQDWTAVFSYAELPYFLTYGFSYCLSTNKSKCRLKRKKWNVDYDHSRFDKGIYNLDRLAIMESEMELEEAEEAYLKSIDWNKIDTVAFNGIVLDGLMCELQIKEKDKSLHWNVEEEMNAELSKLINTIRNW